MTTVVILMLGLGVVLIVSAFEDVSMVQTFSDIWNDKVDLSGGTQTIGGGPAGAIAAANAAAKGQKTANGITQPGIAPGTSVNENWFAARADITRYALQHRYGL